MEIRRPFLPLWETCISIPTLMPIFSEKNVSVSIFLPVSAYDRLVETINSNGFETDEFAAGNFTPENAKTIHAPVIREAFMNVECTLKEVQDLSGAGITAMVIGQVQHISWKKNMRRVMKTVWERRIHDADTGAAGSGKRRTNQSAIATVED